MKLLIRLRPNYVWLVKKVLLVIGLLVTFHVSADELSAKAYLDRIISAQEKQSFTGVFNYSRPGYNIEHYVYQQITKDGKTREWVKQSSKNEGFVLVDREVVCVTKGYKRKFRPNTILQSLTKADLVDLLEDYTVSLSPNEIKVAGRAAKELVFTAKDHYRYMYKMAFDKETFFPLQYVFLDSKGVILETGQFSQFYPIDGKEKLSKPFSGCMKIKRADTASHVTDWAATWKPTGFDLEHVIISKQDGKNKDIQLVYGDGLVFFSVFIEHRTDPRMSNIEKHFGAMVAVSRKVNLSNGKKYFVTVVGEIPFSTAERVALSVQKQLINAKP